MAMTINTNIASLNAQRNLGKSQGMLNKSLQRLSSGLRINSAKDDSAGLAIANRMTSQIRGLDQAVRNANDGISLAQTAEGALQESGNILQRIRELAVQASSDGSTDTDRASMQVEVGQLVAELDRIADTTSFNGQVLLDGSFGTGRFQVGANAGETVSMSMTSAKTGDLGAVEGDSVGNYTLAKLSTAENGGLVDVSTGLDELASGDLTINGTSIRATASGDDLLSSTDNDGSAIAIAAAINSSADTTGVRADVQANSFALGTITTEDDAIAAGEFKINGVDITGDTNDSEVSFAALINAKTADTGVSAVGVDDTSLVLTAADGRNIQITSDGNSILVMSNFNATGALDQAQRAEINLYSNEEFTVAGTTPGNALDLVAGTTALTKSSWVTAAGAGTFENLEAGDLTINGYNVDVASTTGDTEGDSESNVDGGDSAKAIAYAINQTTGLNEQVEATAVTKANLGTISAYAAGDMDLDINGVTIAFDGEIQDNDADGYMVDKLNASFKDAAAGTANHGLVASMNGDNELIITSEDGVNIDVNVSAVSANTVLSEINTAAGTNVVHKGTVSLSAKAGYSVGTIGGEKQALAGITDAGSVSIASISVNTFEDAQTAISSVDTALSQVDDQRAELGAIQNRFDSTIANLSTTSENLSAAKARIMDADFATETASLTKAQILQQAGTAMLAQANQLPQAVLSLLG